jgi:hypothetical protein
VIAALITIFIALLAGLPSAGDDPGGRIFWSASRPLQPSDFRASPVSGGELSAISSWTIETSSLRCAEDGSFHASTRAVFISDQSWIREPPSDGLLAHEQAHFDLAELYARQLSEQFQNELPQICHTAGFAIAAQRIHDEVLDQAERTSARYDSDTDHGRRPDEQQRWRRLISANLGGTPPH